MSRSGCTSTSTTPARASGAPSRGRRTASSIGDPPVPGLAEAAASYVVGDMEDGTSCLACVAMSRRLRSRTLQVWLRMEDGGGSWELLWETKFLSGYSLCAVNAGVVLFEDYRAYRLSEIDELRFGGYPRTEASFLDRRRTRMWHAPPCCWAGSYKTTEMRHARRLGDQLPRPNIIKFLTGRDRATVALAEHHQCTPRSMSYL
ncbi:hypothetical protein PVAP13_5NG226291 [Panicum virgatum]|uniref:Uncharacterized protein n=1 Tax=Panicum virgatum TaxID=38727 RepID=A0A8T0RVM0_PANVG|nr:hypothetical protein PVAP13_5NG226291 [Panicum virgatum]